MNQLPKMAIIRPGKEAMIRERICCAMCKDPIPEGQSYQLVDGKAECDACHKLIVTLLEREQKRA